jgi:hypothetical protein
MKSLKKLKGDIFHWFAGRTKARLISGKADPSIDLSDFQNSLSDPRRYYERAFQEFHHGIPAALREHRSYFNQENRGFGEEAFHTMWHLLIERYKPASFLEIGVYRGQVLSLVSLLSRHFGTECAVTGISPFSPAGDSVSTYLGNLDYQSDTLSNFRFFALPVPELLKAYSTDPEAVSLIASRSWDMIYIDGNHDYEIVKKDWAVCSAAVKQGGLVILDDSGLTTTYSPPIFATGGHPGPSKLASEINPAEFEEILQVGHNRVFKKL